MYRLTRELAASHDLSQALPTVLQLIRDFFQADAAVWLRDENGLTQHLASTFVPSKKDESVAMWAFQKKQAATNWRIRASEAARSPNACSIWASIPLRLRERRRPRS